MYGLLGRHSSLKYAPFNPIMVTRVLRTDAFIGMPGISF